MTKLVLKDVRNRRRFEDGHVLSSPVPNCETDNMDAWITFAVEIDN